MPERNLQQHQLVHFRFLRLMVSIANMDESLLYPTLTARLDAIFISMTVWSMSDASKEESLSSEPDKIRARLSIWLLHTLCLSVAHNRSSPDLTAQRVVLEEIEQDGRFEGFIPTLRDVCAEAEAYRAANLTRIRALSAGETQHYHHFASFIRFPARGPKISLTVATGHCII